MRSAQPWRWVYTDPRWPALRKAHLEAHPWCVDPDQRHDVPVRATDVDHRIPHRGDPALAFSPSNLQSLCRSCHSRKTAIESDFGSVRGDR